MALLAKVIFRKIKETAYVDPENICIKKCDSVLIKTESGLEFAKIIETEKEINSDNNYKVVRICTPEDLQVFKNNEELLTQKKARCNEIIKNSNLDMSLTSLEATYNCDKIFLYYTAEGRIDFRELLKELSTELKTKIQMVQIGVRDESKMIGGLGHCGRVFCCKDFLKSFNPIVIDMAKDQDIPLNPTKISGVCGRLLCCLGYEHEQYKEMASELPNINQSVEVKEIGKGVVIGRDTLKQKVNIRFEDGTTKQFTTTDLIFTKKRREK